MRNGTPMPGSSRNLLAGVDAAVTQTATCEITSLTDSEAVVRFEGATDGAVTGSATKITFDR
jgi:hypothetical protein